MDPTCVTQQRSRVSIEALLHGPVPSAHYYNSSVKVEQSVSDISSVKVEQSVSDSSSVKDQSVSDSSSTDTKVQAIANTLSTDTKIQAISDTSNSKDTPSQDTNTTTISVPSTSNPRPHISCMNCQTTSTPLWRRDPSTGSHLCNRCGLYLKTYNVMHPLIRIKHRPTAKRPIPEMDDVEQVPRPANCHPPQLHLDSVQRRKRVTPKQQISLGITPKCFNCGAEHTPLWRRDPSDNIICNACGLYHKLHDKPRPVAMRRAIKRRNRAVGVQSVPAASTGSLAGLDVLRRAAEMTHTDCQPVLSQSPNLSHPCSMLESLASVATAEIASTSKGAKEHLQKECQRLEQQLAKSKAILSSLT
ncbi:GATA type transcriptional activator of nitrogen-regulated proteins [Coemansia sp. RSA 562]|nr:GATA type transcriptional activator of nitrogen-regulated proteins [Coemansia sp. RSA 564]KAJ2169166.1 GATA type transcriptional activator of nitrogen-regulated proteins [Coemansia sp. RSA 562]KAJ2293777.1 GATA type transcriptional activator of nitrogen-regulated proteins [Coemansia sp. RSA 355]KAJ2410840.1 GATA type transcriptional activator of nitrogen-regulated proteins [Coemansia sp. RSA 2526]